MPTKFLIGEIRYFDKIITDNARMTSQIVKEHYPYLFTNSNLKIILAFLPINCSALKFHFLIILFYTQSREGYFKNFHAFYCINSGDFLDLYQSYIFPWM